MKKIISLMALPAIFAAMLSCNSGENKSKDEKNDSATSPVRLDAAAFQSEMDGKMTALYTLKNPAGTELAITNYGGRFVSLLVSDKNGKKTDVVIGMSSVQGYKNATEPYFGATIGRYGNRIAKGKFFVNRNEYTLALNNGSNTLHGGAKGFQDVVWDAVQPNDSTLVLSYVSPDMESGFPGTLNVKVIYTLTTDHEIWMDYTATTSKPTVINLTNHAFFNLNGEGSGDVLNHKLKIFADKFIPVDSTLIPFGRLDAVQGTPFDFSQPVAIGAHIHDENEQLKFGKGYDHTFVLNGTKAPNGMFHAATAVGDRSGIVLDVFTQEPGVQFYSGNFMQSKNTLKSGTKDDLRTAFCLETQHFPDAPNQPSFPSTVLEPGKIYHTQSVYKFSVGH